MKTIFSSRRHRYLARVGVFLIAIALIVGQPGLPVCYLDGTSRNIR